MIGADKKREMAISKKGKRKLVYNDRVFYWYMKLTDDWMYSYNNPQLHIVSDDRALRISYQPGQQNENPFLIVKGKEFGGLKSEGRSWIRVKTPDWDFEIITPGIVRTVLEWCLDTNKDITLVDYLGRLIEEEE